LADLQVRGSERRANASVDDVVVAGRDGLEVEAYIVRPLEQADSPVSGPGLVLWHWLDTEAPDGNRTQFLDEAAELATSGVTSILPQGRFPWAVGPSSARADTIEIRREVARLYLCLDVLADDPAVDGTRLGIVGHDFGGMLALVATAEHSRARAVVVVAATPRWGDWFLTFWPIEDDRIDYLRALRTLDPVECIGRVTGAPILLQFAERDYYIPLMSARELQRAAPEGTELFTYDAEHDMRLPEIRADRRAFLVRTLGLSAGETASATLVDQAATT
jgi:dienelactone hydrolase